MNTTQAQTAGAAHDPRVRDQVRESVAVVAFTASASALAALALFLLATWAR